MQRCISYTETPSCRRVGDSAEKNETRLAESALELWLMQTTNAAIYWLKMTDKNRNPSGIDTFI